jgi:hypothetical protein
MTKLIIGICGYKGSGKDTIADYIQNQYGFTKLSFGSKIKDIVSILFGWNRTLIEGDTDFSRVYREMEDPWLSEKLKMEITPRKMLQYVGTDLLRNHLSNDIWVYALEKELSSFELVIVSDVRFENEFDMIQRHNGFIISVERDLTHDITDTHESEHIWKKCLDKVNFSIKNDSTKDMLYSKIDEIMANILLNNMTSLKTLFNCNIFSEIGMKLMNLDTSNIYGLEFYTHNKPEFSRRRIWSNELYEIILISWSSNFKSPIHDHPDNGCFVKVLEGTFKETIYNSSLEEIETKLLHINNVSYLHNKIGFHTIQNMTSKQGLTLHVYSPPNYKINIIS